MPVMLESPCPVGPGSMVNVRIGKYQLFTLPDLFLYIPDRIGKDKGKTLCVSICPVQDSLANKAEKVESVDFRSVPVSLTLLR